MITPLQAAMICVDTYDDPKWKVDISQFATLEKIISKDHTQLYVYLVKDGTRVFSFQGTNGVEDWITNLFAILWPSRIHHDLVKGVMIHAGFDLDWCPIEKTVLDLVAQYGVDKVIFAGHSKGAALARRALFEMVWKYGKQVPTFMFGEPNGGNEQYYCDSELCQSYLSSAFSFKNNNDIVTNVPWKWLGYYSPQRIQVSSGKENWSGWMTKMFFWAGNCNDHYPMRYVQALNHYNNDLPLDYLSILSKVHNIDDFKKV
jgi:hypothetical protein